MYIYGERNMFLDSDMEKPGSSDPLPKGQDALQASSECAFNNSSPNSKTNNNKW